MSWINNILELGSNNIFGALVKHNQQKNITTYQSDNVIAFNSKIEPEILINKLFNFLKLIYISNKIHISCVLLANDNSYVFFSFKKNKDLNEVCYYTYTFSFAGPLQKYNEIENKINSIERYNPEFGASSIPPGEVYLLSKNSYGNLYFRSVGKSGSSPLVRENYDELVLKQYDHAVKQLKSINPDGRICILQGPPGTGKTFLIRALMEEMQNIKVIIIPPEHITQLGNPEVIDVLLDEVGLGHPMLFILEDADACLSPRSKDSIDSISRLLNFGDGIIGGMFDIRIICTTNILIEEFDEAIIRPGRLINLINVGKLSYEKAQKRYNQLGGTKELEKREYTIAEIYKLVKQEELLL